MARTIIVDAVLRPSREFGILLAAVHGVAAASPWLAGLPAWSCVGIGVLVLGCGCRQVREVAALRGANAVTRFQLHGDGRMRVHRVGGEVCDGDCPGIETLGRWAVVLQFRESGVRMNRLVVWRDQSDARALRRLRIAARWNAGVTAGDESRT